MLNAWVIAAMSLLYVAGLFAIAWYVDRRARTGVNLVSSPLVYSLSLAVYVTSWTFYGSVGRAASSGSDFLPIYLGPTLVAVVWWLVLRKTVRIARANGITSIADFLGARYGGSALVAGVVAAIAVVGVTPYIALQLKAISQSFQVLSRSPEIPLSAPPGASTPFYADGAFGAAIVLIAFAIIFGARDLDSSRRHEGLVATIAFESLVKLVALLAVGIFATWVAFGGFGDLFERAAREPRLAALLPGGAAPAHDDWAALTMLSMLAILLLPRQFQMAVVGNTREAHIRTAMWLFPAYLLVINIFVLPIALAGLLTFANAPAIAADYFVLTLPMQHQQEGLALLAFIGGISSATSMVIVESIALSTMVLNSLVVPWLVRPGLRRAAEGAALRDVSGLLLTSKRMAIAAIILLGYVYERLIGESYTLVNIGLISFGAVAQFAPAYFGALYWRSATRPGALGGLVVGFIIWAYTLLLPSFVSSGWLPDTLLSDGPLGLAWLRPDQLFGATGLGFWANTVFWSLLGNAGTFAVVSLCTRPTEAEAAQSTAFVDVFRGAAAAFSPVQPPELLPTRLREVLAKFVGREAADAAFSRSSDRSEFLQVAERALSGALGAPSAQAILDGLMRPEVPRFAAIIDIIGSVSQSLEQSRVDLQRRIREVSLLYEATSRIAGTLDPRHMMDEVLALLRREFQFDTLIVRLQDAEGRLRIESQFGLDPSLDGHAGGGELPSRETYFGDCFLDNRVVVLEDPAQPEKKPWRPTTAALARHSFIHAPITVEARPIGVLSAYASFERAHFTPEFVKFFQTVAAQLGLGLQNARLFRELGMLSEELEAKVRQRTSELEAANERLTELDRLKSDFVSTVSHELRTPLTTIRSLSESLLDGLNSGGIPLELQEQFLGIIVQESQRLSRLISQLLDLARIEAGKMAWHPEPFDLAEETSDVVRANRPLFETKGVALSVSMCNGEIAVVADRDRVTQVLTNLLSNAAKFTPVGGRVVVRAFSEDALAVVEVEDTGSGIEPDQLEAVFERFRQVGDTLTSKPEGAGLGLPISRQLVEHQGGTLTARSVPGRGSTFRMTLPLALGGGQPPLVRQLESHA